MKSEDANYRDANYWIDRLALTPHPEGGHYRVTYKADLQLPRSALPAGFGGDRSASTAIYFLLQADDFSALHRIASDELWHFYGGDALVIHIIDPAGNDSKLLLGPQSDSGQQFQAVVRAGCWFGATLEASDSFALVGCTVAPGFDFADFELAERANLMALYPRRRSLIERLTR